MASYQYKCVATIGETNCFQNVYFTNHFRISGITRELWVRDCVPGFARYLESGLRVITANASCQFVKDFYAFDPIRVDMVVRHLGRASMEPVFRFYHDATNKLHAEARHKLVFADKNHTICRIPDDFRNAAKMIEEVEAPGERRPENSSGGGWGSGGRALASLET